MCTAREQTRDTPLAPGRLGALVALLTCSHVRRGDGHDVQRLDAS